MGWDWDFTLQIIPRLFDGAVVTVIATLLGSALAMVLGLVFALLVRSSNQFVRLTTTSFVEFVRRTPLLVQLYFLFYALPDLGILLSPLMAGVLGLGIHYAAYTSQVYRAGIENVPLGQWEAAKSCNLQRSHIWRHIILPQAIRPMIPALTNYLIVMFKETPMLATITVVELMQQAFSIANYNYRYLEPLTMVGVFFIVITIPTMLGARYLERRFQNAP